MLIFYFLNFDTSVLFKFVFAYIKFLCSPVQVLYYSLRRFHSSQRTTIITTTKYLIQDIQFQPLWLSWAFLILYFWSHGCRQRQVSEARTYTGRFQGIGYWASSELPLASVQVLNHFSIIIYIINTNTYLGLETCFVKRS